MIYMLKIGEEEWSFKSEELRETFTNGFLYATFGDDPEGHNNAPDTLGIEEWEVE